MVINSTNINKVNDLESRLGELHSLQNYVIKFVSNLRQNGGFLRLLLFPPTIELIATI